MELALRRRLTCGPSEIALFLVCLAIAPGAQARFLSECDIEHESGRFGPQGSNPWALRFCDTRESVYVKWDAKLQKLDTGWTELQKAASAGDWAMYRSKWAELLPVMRDLEAAAAAQPSVPGADRMLGLYRTDIGARLYHAGFGTAGSLDASSARILAGLGAARAWVAAGIGVETVLESKQLGYYFVLGMAAAASDKVVDAYRAQAKQKR